LQRTRLRQNSAEEQVQERGGRLCRICPRQPQFGVDCHNTADGIWQAQTGDFLVVPNPNANWNLPYCENTTIIFCDMMTEAHQPFDGGREFAARLSGRMCGTGVHGDFS